MPTGSRLTSGFHSPGSLVKGAARSLRIRLARNWRPLHPWTVITDSPMAEMVALAAWIVTKELTMSARVFVAPLISRTVLKAMRDAKKTMNRTM